MFKLEEDLISEIRCFDSSDDENWPPLKTQEELHQATYGPRNHPEITDCNLRHLKETFLKTRDDCGLIMEIGVNRNGPRSFTQSFLSLKKQETTYLGVDLEDKKYLNSEPRNIHTLQTDSRNYDEIISYIELLGKKEIDFLFIDGWHSVNQIYYDWEFTKNLSAKGVVGVHDTNAHPGPYKLVQNINKDSWNVNVCCLADWGVAFLSRKST